LFGFLGFALIRDGIFFLKNFFDLP